jgi:AGZA family xanthine/uracil permease-like MFS transporter
VRRFLERFFRLPEHGTTVRTELLGGATTFVTMAYIIVVNPAILNAADIPTGPSTVATILAAVFGCLLMGLYASRPLAVAPYMGENAFIAFSLSVMLIDGMRVTWQQRLGSVFVAGVAFLVLTLLGLRTWLARAVSPSMKYSFAAGIGLFLLLIGMYETGIVTSSVTGMAPGALRFRDAEARQQPPAAAAAVGLLGSPAGGPLLATSALVASRPTVAAPPDTPLKLGDLRDVRVLLAAGGFVLIAVLLYWNVRGGILIGIILTAAAGYALGVGQAPERVVALPWDEEYDLSQVAGQLKIGEVLRLSFLPVLITLCLVSFLDTLGTLVGVGAAGGMLDEKGDFKEIEKPMLVDAVSCMFSAVIGTSTSGAYIESAAGIREGARTGLAAVATGLLFALALFFIPLLEPLQQLRYAYGPALMAVGLLMLGAVQKVDFADLTEAVPAVGTIAMMLFSYNIANGLTAGLVLYPVFKVLAGRWRELSGGAVALGLLCLVYFLFGVPH